jgi:site-specific DNA-cytosine methylase
LAEQYPMQLPVTALQHAFDAMPHDSRFITSDALVAAGAKNGEQYLVVSGWECQSFSSAGKGLGLDSADARSYYDTVRLVGALQQLQPHKRPAYVLENAPMQFNFAHKHIRDRDFPIICATIGTPVLLDAARFGSFAHRVRNYWTNLADAALLQQLVEAAIRPAGLVVQIVLDEGRYVRKARQGERPPQYPCNKA